VRVVAGMREGHQFNFFRYPELRVIKVITG
jgi:hypothetical protein